jgi:ADP-ribose pyrophosphatase YjhB (NUDIX family)
MREYPDAPRVGIGIVLLRGDEVLLVRRATPPGVGQWSLPGGAQELGETAEDCARRELFEETGLSAGPLHMVAHVDSINRDDDGRVQYHYTILDFAAHYEGGELAPADDVSDAQWVHPDRFDAFNLWSEQRRIIALAFSQLRI